MYEARHKCLRLGNSWILVLITVALTASAVSAQSRREEFLNVKSWRGSFDLSVDTRGESNGVKWMYQGTVSGQLLLDTPDLTSNRWRGKIPSSTVNLKAEDSYATGAGGQCSVTNSFAFNGSFDPGATTELRVFLDVWDLTISATVFKAGTATQTQKTVCPDGTTTRTSQWITGIPTFSPLKFAYPPQGLSLEGSGKAGAVSGIAEPVAAQLVDWNVHFRVEPAVDNLLLEVTSPQYDTWRPAAEPGPKAGEPIKFTATLKRASGETAQVNVSRFVWELVDTSREPGIAINFPLYASDQDPDLKFDPQPGQFVTGADNQKVERPVPDSPQDNAVVLPYDWGAWSTLQVTAYLSDGGKVVGKLKGSDEEGVRLPKRAKDSFIADGWRAAGEGRAGKDDSDDENDPEGDGNRGDGLTLYEEYRGFYEDGAHREGNPAKKDYFAYNAGGSMGEGGLMHFRRISGLDVHYRLNRNEFDMVGHVVNGNHSASPHRGDQHGVWLKYAGFDGYAQAVSTGSGPSTPKDFQYVGLPVSIPGRSTAGGAVSYASATIAHELLHTVNVWHHGDEDRTVVWQHSGGLLLELETGADGSPSGDGFPIRVFREDGNEVTASVLARLADGGGRSQYIGARNGQHSGYEDCVMRYDIAGAYGSDVTLSDRYLVIPSEIPGAHLCDMREGLAVNADGRSPQPRYFAAAPNRGDCKHQILVNDQVPAPRR